MMQLNNISSRMEKVNENKSGRVTNIFYHKFIQATFGYNICKFE